MKIKKFAILFTFVAVFILAFTCTAFASEVTLYEENMSGVYGRDALNKIHVWTESNYVNGKSWFCEWGEEGWFEDSKNGLVFFPKVGGKYEEEKTLWHKIIGDNLPEDTKMEFTLEFDTFDKPEHSSGEFWFKYDAKNEDKSASQSSVLFMLKSSSTSDAYTCGFASLTNGYPMELKKFDRVRGDISFDFNKHYKVIITMEPSDVSYKLIATVYENDVEKGKGIIEKYEFAKNNSFIHIPNAIGFNNIVRSTPTDKEPMLCVNSVKVRAIYKDTKLDAEYFPSNNSENIALDTACYADFSMPLEDISIDNVSVSSGAYVENAYLSNDGKRVNVVLGGLKAGTLYEIELKDICAVGANTSFAYKWNFTTGNAVRIKNVSTLTESYSQDMNTLELDNLVPNTDESYLYGDSWSYVGTNPQNEFYTDNEYLYLRASLRGDSWSDYKLSKKIEPVSGGNTMILKTTIKQFDPSKLDNPWTRGASIRLVDTENPSNNMTIYRTTYNGVFALGMDSSVGTAPDSGDEQAIKGLKVGSDAEFELVLSPNGDNYLVVLTVTQDGKKIATLSKTLTASQAEGFDAIQIWSASMKITGEYNTFGIKNITENLGVYSLDAGTNKFYFDYENADTQNDGNFDVIIIEHKSDSGEGFGKIKNISVKEFRNITSKKEKMECEFEVVDPDSKIDIYFVSSVDSMGLLSDKAEL